MASATFLAVFACWVVYCSSAPTLITNYLTCGHNAWTRVGCRVNKTDTDLELMALGDLRRQYTIDYDKKSQFIVHVGCWCREKAMKLKRKFFVLEMTGVCFVSKEDVDLPTYQKKHPLDSQEECLKSNSKSIITNDKDGRICFGGEFKAFYFQINEVQQVAADEGAQENEEEEAEEACRKKSDIVVAVDSSGSIGSQHFHEVLDFSKKLSERFDIGRFPQHQSRFAFIRFDHTAELVVNWTASETMSKQEIKQKIENTKYTGGATATNKAMEIVTSILVKKMRLKRANIPITFFLITDGKCWRGEQLLPPVIQQFRVNHINTVAVGIGNEVDGFELNDIAGSNKNVFHFINFKAIINHAPHVLNQLVKQSCG